MSRALPDELIVQLVIMWSTQQAQCSNVKEDNLQNTRACTAKLLEVKQKVRSLKDAKNWQI